MSGLGWIIKAVEGFQRLGKKVNNATNILDSFEITPEDVESGKNQIFRTELTGAEREANAFSADEAQKNRDFQLEMDSTKYQRQVADMKAAGINPMMAAGGTPTTPSGSAASPAASGEGSGINLGSVLQLLSLPAQIEKTKAEADEAKAGAQNKRSEAESRDRLTPKQIEEIEQRIAESIAREHDKWKEAEERDYKIQLAISESLLADAQAHLAEVSAEDIQALRQSKIALNEAKAGREKNEAVLAYYNALYQKGLVDNDMPRKVVEKIDAETIQAIASANHMDAQRVRQEIENSIKNGTWSKEIKTEGTNWDRFLMHLDRATSTLGNVLSLHN